MYIYDEGDFDSPLEEKAAHQIQKYFADNVLITPQERIETEFGRFRLDFLAQVANKRIAIECDGRDFHDEYRDSWRDAILLGAKHVDVIYRWPGRLIHRGLETAFDLMAHYDPELFSSRSVEVLGGIRRRAIEEFEKTNGIPQFSYQVIPNQEWLGPDCRRWSNPPVCLQAFWPKIYEWAKAKRGDCRNVDELIASHRIDVREWLKGQ